MAPVLDEEELALDPYAILGLESGATEKEIRGAFRKKSLKCHPDRNPTPEAAIQFRQLYVAQEILTDPTKRNYVDNKLESDRKKRERYAEMDKKRKAMVDALNAREEEAKRARVDAVQRRKQAAEEEAIKDQGRRLVEEAQKKAALAAAAATAASKPSPVPEPSNGSASRKAEITPTDLTLIISVPPTSAITAPDSAQLQSSLERRYGPISHLILNDPPKVQGKKKKGKKVVVEFGKGNWGGCWACWKDVELGKSGVAGLEDGKAKWAAGEVPAWVEWAEQQKSANGTSGGGGGAKAPAQSGNGNANGNGIGNGNGVSVPLPAASFNGGAPSFDSAPDLGAGGTTMASLLASHARNKADTLAHKRKNDEFESMTLLRMRQMERERLEEQIRLEEGDD